MGGSNTAGKSDVASLICLLTVRYVASLCEGFCLVHRLDNTAVVQKSRTAGESATKAPPAIDVDKTSQDDK